MAFFDDSLIAHLIHSFGVRIQRKGQRLVGEMLLKGYRRLLASLRHWGFDLYGGSSGIEGHPLHFAFFFPPPPVHLNMIYTNQIKIDTGQRTTDQLIARRLMLRINSLVIFQFTACIAWVVQGLVFFYGSHLFSEWFPGTQVGGIILLSRSTLTKKSKRSTGVMCVRQKFGGEKINKVNLWEVLFFYFYLHGTLPSDDKCYHYNTIDNQ